MLDVVEEPIPVHDPETALFFDRTDGTPRPWYLARTSSTLNDWHGPKNAVLVVCLDLEYDAPWDDAWRARARDVIHVLQEDVDDLADGAEVELSRRFKLRGVSRRRGAARPG